MICPLRLLLVMAIIAASICISSIYGRSRSRIFSKPYCEGKSLVSLSQEELESWNEALGERTNEESVNGRHRFK